MSNLVGQIYGTIKNGKSTIKLESDYVDIDGLLSTRNVGNHNMSKLTLVGNEIKKHEDPWYTSNLHYKKGKWHNWYHNGNNTTYPSSGDFGYNVDSQYTYYRNNIQLYNGYEHNGTNRRFPPNNIIGTQSNSNQGSLDSGDEAFCLNTFYHLNTFTGWDISYANKAWCPWTGFDVDSSMNNDNDTFFKKDTYGIEVQKSGFYNIVYNTQWNYNSTYWQTELGFDKIGLIAVLLKNPGRSNQQHILIDDINESISSLRRRSDIWQYPASYYSGDINVFNIYLEQGESIGVGYLGFLYDEYRTDTVNNFAYQHQYYRYSSGRQSLNTLGWYGWERRQDLKVHNIKLNKLEIQAITSSTINHVSQSISKGMVVQVQHKDYKKTVKKNSTGWTAIDNNLETGFVVAIKPSSSTSNVFVSCNLHVSINTAAVVGQHYWGGRLYRKIGNGDWTHVIEATGEQTNGTPIWLTDATHENDTNSQYRLINLGNSFLDSPGTTEIVYYTIYWANIYEDTENNKDLLYLNRSTADWATIDDSWNALPISNITAKEIWNSGTAYTPTTTLIREDLLNNNVDITGTLNVQGEKVITVPALDICGNALSANTTYEVTTGPSGNINNISFVKKQPEYILSAYKSDDQSLNHGYNQEVRGFQVGVQKNTGFNVGDVLAASNARFVWQCPANGFYHIIFEAVLEDLANEINGYERVLLQIKEQKTSDASPQVVKAMDWYTHGGGNDNPRHISVSCTTILELSTNDEISFYLGLLMDNSNSNIAKLMGLVGSRKANTLVHFIRMA